MYAHTHTRPYVHMTVMYVPVYSETKDYFSQLLSCSV